jgi:uncharacterized protein (UPF0303 family)
MVKKMEYKFEEFKNEDALKFGLTVLEIIKRESIKNVRIRVKYNGDIVFQYIMDGKNGEDWLNRKEKTVMETGHSTMYVFEHQEDYPHMIDNDEYAVCGGGYPLIVNDELKGVFIISGLRHDEDHALIIKALKEMGE